MTLEQQTLFASARASSKAYFAEDIRKKASFVNSTTYSGYNTSGEEVIDGVAESDPQVIYDWLCHGQAPWPSESYKQDLTAWIDSFGNFGDRILRLVALGLGLRGECPDRAYERQHHMRALRHPEAKGSGRGLGAYMGHGLLVILAQDATGGLQIRPPVRGERRPCNWRDGESMPGAFENDDKCI
ncbi:hypothetical protein L873DRAFT_1804357 [Choiromyces venosus 120613-1]|uniref:Uncharacterized protein n=1 Tax=Choiromyces venosus 120613-1 TaxID=1336337 RepID=A0A3N4JY17_9PEZI|nr:hypothetical protein L873DRAFT_1804357 [Choiromyces venosus 120613-1]